MFGGVWDSLRKKCVVADCKLENTNYHELTINYQNRLTRFCQTRRTTQQQIKQRFFWLHLTRMARKDLNQCTMQNAQFWR